MPALTVQNAEIKTATVEVRTLTISGKQVTLAVFRQLVNEDLIDGAGQFRGLPWGTVNYHPDKCDRAVRHVHVVWQLGTDLRRSRVNRPNWHGETFFDESNFVQASFCLNGHRLPEWAERKRVDGWYEVLYDFDGMRCDTSEPLGPEGYASDHKCLTTEELAEHRAFLAADVAKEKERRVRVAARWEELQALPQLFIAV
jgi:hypothetical protein